MKVSIDFDYVPTRQNEIHERLENWARWVCVKPQSWGQQPMFRQYRSKAWQWETPETRPATNTLDAHEIEKVISRMDASMAHVLRWAYVFPYIDPRKVGRNVGKTQDALVDLLLNARDIVKNTCKLHKTHI